MKNMYSVINWFNTTENKCQCFFILLDIVEFYPSISENILDTGIYFSKQHTDIFDKNLRIIKHYDKILLLKNTITLEKEEHRQFFRCDNGKLR